MSKRLLYTTASSVSCAAAAYTVAIVVSGPVPLASGRGALTVLGAVLTVLAVGIPAMEQRKRERKLISARSAADEASARLQTAINDSLAPVAQQIGKVASAGSVKEREALCAQAVTKVLTSAVGLIGPQRARACWYRITEHDPRVLRPADHHGRSTAPTTAFREGTPEGDAVFAALDRGEGRINYDIRATPPTGWDANRSRAYRTFIAVPVAANGRCFGMLTVDSLRAGELRGEDVPVLRLLADLLADALAVGSVHVTAPETPDSQPVDLTRGDLRSEDAVN